ncbi:molybdopterin-dependent oxidoreductase, partial [Candidatus Dependentiae bacterium]|nr:molybdopterin-dependent oxidoreductase [Candidatus Dependentiae bacterium]
LETTNAIKCWEALDQNVNIEKRIKSVTEYNKKYSDTKKGIAVIPVCFGISFAQTTLNQASALVNIYIDGSVSVSTGAVEMGQGVNSKIISIVAKTLCISNEKVRVDTTNTLRIPNASPTSASTGADLNGMAAKNAGEELLNRLKKFAAKKLNHDNPDDISIRNEIVFIKSAQTDYKWEELITDAYMDRTDLSCHSFYATPAIYIDRVKERGRPFAYYSYGTSVTEVIVDCVRGTYEIESVDVVHDVGQSLSIEIDKGQVEGAVIQGIGWATIEQIKYDKNCKVLTAVNSYKIPDIKFCPKNFNITLLENSFNPFAVSNSKAVGEPPFVHGLGAYFAILNALRCIRKDKPAPSLPLTPEKVFMYIHE